MKVTLDLSKLLAEGTITRAEHDRLASLGQRETGQVLINVLIGFGVVAVSAGALLLMPSVVTIMALGMPLMAAGMALNWAGRVRWSVLATICILVAALLLGAGIILLTQGARTFDDADSRRALMSLPAASLLVAALFAASAALARSALLAALAVVVVFSTLGSNASYSHAAYGLEVTQPLATVVLFSALAWGAYLVSRILRADWERLAITVARTSVFLVNLGFWIGSLWGDRLDWLAHPPKDGIAPLVFAIAWAVALFAAALWSARANRRWMLNLVAVFGGIHFYTQWFEHLGADPVSVLGAGVLVLVFAMGLWQLNHRALSR
jgi:iron complex transport system permease protein